ncbi:AI-2E family transporter [Candidatus Woesearchaeota archaeon]|nr:AI-2E family transporter [Candidatus Woesearchaeota archaeon]
MVKKKAKEVVNGGILNGNSYPSYIFLLLLIGFIYVSYNVIYPFFSAILSGILLAFAVHPVYDFLKRIIANETFRAIIITLLLFVFLTAPFVYVLSHVTRQSVFEQSDNLYNDIRKRLLEGNIFGIECEDTISTICKVNNNINKWLRTEKVKNYITNVSEQIINHATALMIDILLTVPSILFNLIISILATFYFLRDGKYLSQRLIRLLPLKEHHQEELFTKAYGVTYAVVYGSILVALIQAVYAGIGFSILRFPNALFVSILIGFTALIPYLGAWIVWVPSVLYYVLVQSAAGNVNPGYWVILAIFALSISLIDNFIKPFIIGSGAKVNALIIFVGVIGGLMFFGVLGFIFGPIVLALTQVLFEMYERERYCEK